MNKYIVIHLASLQNLISVSEILLFDANLNTVFLKTHVCKNLIFLIEMKSALCCYLPYVPINDSGYFSRGEGGGG